MNSPDATILASFVQLPQDPSSGAARSMCTICELLALGGWRVHVVGSTATDGGLDREPLEWLRSRGLDPKVHAGPQSSRVLHFRDLNIDYSILDLGLAKVSDTRQYSDDAFDLLFDEVFSNMRPRIFLTYGGSIPELDRRRKARKAGCAVVFAIHTESYVCEAAFADIDVSFSPSHYLSNRCRSALGVGVAVLPLPIRRDQVVAVSHDPTFVTFINPEPLKGVAVFARIAEEISRHNPDVPFLIVKSRGDADDLIASGLAGGFDLRRHPNIALAAPVPDPKAIFGVTRVLLVPSLEETAGRVAAEALLNGIPVVASDRGGLPETLRGGGFILPLPDGSSAATPIPPSADAVRPWIDLTVRLMTSWDAYQEAHDRALRIASFYDEEALVSTYGNFFEEIRRAARF